MLRKNHYNDVINSRMISMHIIRKQTLALTIFKLCTNVRNIQVLTHYKIRESFDQIGFKHLTTLSKHLP